MNNFLIVPIISLLISQFIKMGIFAKQGKFSWNDFDSYGGMPSSHASFMAAALVEAYQNYGLSSPIFAIITFITFLVLRDAVGLRRTVGYHANLINQLVKDLPDNLEGKYPHLEPRPCHTFPQIAVGFILGIIFAVII